ncbi:MAG: hypothetical protein GQ525_12115 [Draconibacterium sp.]|nr:hypothetical protein [Draconibacterium sp.]
MNKNDILLSTAYFAPIQFYARFIAHPKVHIEQFEHFNKQTYRNRCVILGGNGPISLIVPVIKGRGSKILIKDLKISYEMDWQRNHWRTIFSAFNSSPYFEYYKDDIKPIFSKQTKYLLDLNQSINEIICELLEIDNTTKRTVDFEKVPESTLNFRDIISPKNRTQPDTNFHPKEYTQVFSEKFKFSQNMSILDLLFNEGPNSYTILDESLKS